MQYLVNWRLFFNEECKNFPAEICFPQYFYLCIISIIQHYFYKNDVILRVVEKFYHDLQCIVDSIFPNKKIILKNPKEIADMIKDFKNSEVCYLETFIRDEDGKSNYREGLLQKSLEYYEKENLRDVIAYLCANDCCTVEEKDENILSQTQFPHSKHYVTLGTNCTLKKYFVNNNFGPNIWGPFYWIIFHRLANVCRNKDVLNNYLKILPAVIPCEFCRMNYYKYVRPSTLPEITSLDAAVVAYSNVHNLVTKHKK